MGRGNTKRRATGVIAGAALAAVLPVLAACSSGDSDDSGDSAKASASASASGSGEDGATDAPSDGASGADGADGADQPSGAGKATAQQAVSAWLTALLKHDYKQACSMSAEPASNGKPAQFAPPEMCEGKGTMGERMTSAYDSYRKAFTPKGASGAPTVVVNKAPVKGKTATVPAKAITVDGQRLNKIVLSNSTGVKPGQVHITFQAIEINGSWYSGDLDFQIGNAS